MEENPYKAPVERGAPMTTPAPTPSTFWTLVQIGSAMWWLGMNAVFLSVATGLFDPRRDDNLPPDRFGLWCLAMAAEWLFSGAWLIVSTIKLRRPTA